MHIYFNNHDMEIITAHNVLIYLTIQTKYILLDMVALALITSWRRFGKALQTAQMSFWKILAHSCLNFFFKASTF